MENALRIPLLQWLDWRIIGQLADYWTNRRVVCRVEEEVSDNELRSLRDS